MDVKPDFNALARSLERRPDIRDRTIAEIPELAAPRLYWRRRWHRYANAAFALAVFNLLIATYPGFTLWPLSALCAGLCVWIMFLAEGRARDMTRQLHRRASVQMARDLLEMRDD